VSELIDWNVELKKIEREFDGHPSPAAMRARREAERQEQLRREGQAAALGISLRLLLVLALGGAILYWPYPATCGMKLAAYLGAICAVGLGGLWTALLTWRYRMPIGHTFAIIAMMWALILGAGQALPRLGSPNRGVPPSMPWRCG